MNWGYRIKGPCTGERRRVPWQAAFLAYCVCDPKAHVQTEGYLSAFVFSDDFAEHLRRIGSTKGFNGECWAPWLWFDIDRDESAGGIAAALVDARKLAVALADGYGVDDTAQLWFFSGSKGFHGGIPTALWAPEPTEDFNRVARQLAESIAATAGVAIDTGVYDKVRAFRAPNSRHPKTGRYKRRLTTDELLKVSPEAILKLAETPEPFELPDVPAESADFLVAEWDKATQQARQQAEAIEQRREATVTAPTLNRQTLAFIRDGAETGDRHRLLFSAAANLAEFGCPPGLAHALLTESALDCGLPPSETHRQIECGLASPEGGTP